MIDEKKPANQINEIVATAVFEYCQHDEIVSDYVDSFNRFNNSRDHLVPNILKYETPAHFVQKNEKQPIHPYICSETICKMKKGDNVL